MGIQGKSLSKVPLIWLLEAFRTTFKCVRSGVFDMPSGDRHFRHRVGRPVKQENLAFRQILLSCLKSIIETRLL